MAIDVVAHSPGPWDYDHPHGEDTLSIVLGYPVDGAGCPIVVADIYLGDEDDEEDFPITKAVARANARLIKNAPELLLALQELIQKTNFETAGYDQKCAIYRAKSLVRQVTGIDDSRTASKS